MTKEELFETNQNIVYDILKRYTPTQYYTKEDLSQIAFLGLWKASLKFKEEYNFKFSTFAYKVITNELNYALRTLNKPFNKVIVSFEDTIKQNNEESLTYKDILKDDIDIDSIIINKQIEQIKLKELEKLSEKHRNIYLLLEQGLTQSEVADKFNTSQPQICRIQQKIIKKIKDKLKEVL